MKSIVIITSIIMSHGGELLGGALAKAAPVLPQHEAPAFDLVRTLTWAGPDYPFRPLEEFR